MEEYKDLMLRIVRCPHLKLCWEAEMGDDLCDVFVRYQKEEKGFSDDYFHSQVPEPWSGHIDKAPILFVSSICGFAADEYYPLQHWDDDRIYDFFTNRFDDNIKDGLHYRKSCGSFSSSWTRYWGAVRRHSAELLGREPEPGVDYALTELVHCKSGAETGVSEARGRCCSEYLGDILSLSSAKVIVCMGDYARQTLQSLLPDSVVCEDGSRCIGPADLYGRKRFIVFLPHSNAHKERSIRHCIPDHLPRLREYLSI